MANKSGNDNANVRMGKKAGISSQAFALNYDAYTGYYAITNYGSGKVLDIAQGSTKSGANVLQYAPNKTASQWWRVVEHTNGSISIVSAMSNKALDIAGASVKNGANVLVNTINKDAASQQFKLVATTPRAAEGIYRIQNGSAKSLVMDVPGGSTSAGEQIGLYKANSTFAQTFVVESDGTGAFTLQSVVSGLYLSTNEKGRVTQEAKSTAFSQKWMITPTKNGHFTIIAADNGKRIGAKQWKQDATLYSATKASNAVWNLAGVPLLSSGYYTIRLAQNPDTALEVYYNSTKSGGNITAWHAMNHNSQKFYISPTNDGYYSIYGAWSTLALDVKGGNAKSGTNVQQYDDNKTPAQKWQIVWKDGAFIFKSALGDFSLSLSGTSAGANAQLASYNEKSVNQRFLLNQTTRTRATVSDLIEVLDTYATGNGLKTFKSPNSISEETRAAIWDALYGFWDIGRSVGFTLIDLVTGAGITYNSDTTYYSACSIKAPYSIALSEYNPSALWEWENSFWHALDYSNNETYKNYFYHYGRWPLENYVDIGHVENFSWTGWTAYYTAEDLCRMWVVSQDYLLGDTENAAWLRDVLDSNTAGMTRAAAGWHGVKTVYAKSGWIDYARTEGSLVMDGDHPYVCGIMSSTDNNHSYLVTKLADALYRAHRELIY